MAEVKKVTLKRFNGTDNDDLHPTTDWEQIEDKPTTFTPTAHNLNSHSDVNATPTANGQVLTWDADNSVWIASTTAGGGVSKEDLQNVYVYGKADVAITAGQAIQFAGAQGGHILIKPAVPSEINANPNYIIGIAETNLAQNAFGYVIVNGRLNVNTSVWSEGDILYFASAGSTAGALTTTEPGDPNACIEMAAVTVDGVGNGELLVRTSILTRTIDEVTGLQAALDSKVDLAGDTMTGQLIIDNEGGTTPNFIIQGDGEQTFRFHNTAATGSTRTSWKMADRVNTDWRWILYNDVAGDGTESFQIRGRDTGVAFHANATGVGIGTDNPGYKLDINNSTNYTHLRLGGSGAPLIKFAQDSYNSGNGAELWQQDGKFYINTRSDLNAMVIDTSGNVGIGTNSPAQKLDVVGNIAVSGTVDGVDIAAFKSAYDSHTHTFASLTSKPTTLSGYGITDADTSSQVDSKISTAVSNLVNGASSAFDTLKEIQDAMATDTELANAIAGLTIGNGTQTISAGGGMTGGGSFTANQTGNSTVTISHADTSSQGSVNNSGRTYIQDITLDTYGHITGITSATETVVNTDTNYYLTGVSGSGNGTVTFTRQGLGNLTWNASHTHDDRYYTESEADGRFIPLATSFVSNLDSVTANGVYRQETPSSGFNYTTTMNFTSSDGRQQLTIARDGSGMKFRGNNTGSGTSGWTSWKEVIHSGNIGSQSVNYANTAGSATSATSAGTTDNIDGVAFRNTNSNSGVNADTLNSNGTTYYVAGVPNFSGNATDGALYSAIYSADWQHQIAGDFRSGQIALRGKNSGTWQSWRTVLDSSNFSSWALPVGGKAADSNLLDGIDSSGFWTKSGSWVGDLGSNGYSRVQGVTSGGGEFVLALKSGQISTLLDGQYISYESAGGFFHAADSVYGNANGIRSIDSTTLNVQQLDGGNANLRVSGDITGRNVAGQYSSIYKIGGIYFGWSNDTYGVQNDHSIRSTYGNTYQDSLTMNSYNHIRFNIDSNNNNTGSVFEVGVNTTDTGNVLMQLNDSGNLSLTGRMSPAAWTTTARNYSYEWIEFPNYSGLYSPLNGAHFYPNNGTYGSWRIAGSRNGWAGLELDGSNGNVSIMSNPSSNGFGVHANNFGWKFLWESGTMYVYKNSYGGGTQATVWDSVNLTNLNQLSNGPGYVTSSGVTSVTSGDSYILMGGTSTAPTVNISSTTGSYLIPTMTNLSTSRVTGTSFTSLGSQTLTGNRTYRVSVYGTYTITYSGTSFVPYIGLFFSSTTNIVLDGIIEMTKTTAGTSSYITSLYTTSTLASGSSGSFTTGAYHPGTSSGIYPFYIDVTVGVGPVTPTIYVGGKISAAGGGGGFQIDSGTRMVIQRIS